MHIPVISTILNGPSTASRQKLYRRKGGGAKGGGGGVSRSGGGSGRSGVSNAGVSGTSRSASTYGSGGGSQTTIPGGSAFAGRTQGGGTRDNVYGNQQYGSGYPGVGSAGVAGRGFPFVYWPLAWGGAAGIGGAAYYHNSEYGRHDNSSRPGGVMVVAAFVSASTTNPTTFRLVADNQTVTDLIPEIVSTCSSSNLDTSTSSSSPSAYQDSPLPPSAIQYYRASSVSLTLDGYNNSAVFSEDVNAANTPLPTNIDTTLLNCLNTTIGEAVPLVDNGAIRANGGAMGVFALVWVLWYLLVDVL